MNINQYIDHTLLKPTAIQADIKQLCEEAIEHDFYAVCVNPYWVRFVHNQLKETPVKIASVIGFPLGVASTEIKVMEASKAIKDGADEIDMVINHALLKEGLDDVFTEEIRQIKQAIGDGVLKVIIETCYLNQEEIVRASKLCVKAGADYVKTSTGFGTGGATFEHIQWMKEAVNGQAELKASGGVRDYETAKKYVDMGVRRLGTSSGITIVTGGESKESY